MKLDLHYNFDDYYRDGADTIHVINPDYIYTIEINLDTISNKYIDILNKRYRKDALEEAAFKQMYSYGK